MITSKPLDLLMQHLDGQTRGLPSRFPDADDLAALGICESLLLALTDSKIISEQDVRDVLTDVATTYQSAVATSENPEKHQAVIAIVQRILTGKNGVRH